MAARKTYMRFGEVPEGERSGIGASPNWIHAMGRRTDAEAGVSAYEVERDPARGIWEVVGCANHATANELVARASAGRCRAYLVRGTEVRWADLDAAERAVHEWVPGGRVRGTDGEPLLRGVSIIREVGMNEVAFPGAYDPDTDRPDEMVLWEDVEASGELRIGGASLARSADRVIAALRGAGTAGEGPVAAALSAAGWEVRDGWRGLALSSGRDGMFGGPWTPAAAAVVASLSAAGAAGTLTVRSEGHAAAYAMAGGRLLVTCRETDPGPSPSATIR